MNGRAGKGTKEFDREEDEQLARELNEEYPQILHEAVIAPKEPVEGEQKSEDSYVLHECSRWSAGGGIHVWPRPRFARGHQRV